MNQHNANPSESWQWLAPVLDEALGRLSAADRDAIVLRFYEGQDLRAIWSALGMSEDAAQKRVFRALEKLRVLLLRRGVGFSLSTTDLAVDLAYHKRGIGTELIRMTQSQLHPKATVKLLAAVEAKAKELGCSKLTLEVQENNSRARGIYEAAGFAQAVYGETTGGSLFYADAVRLLIEQHARLVNFSRLRRT